MIFYSLNNISKLPQYELLSDEIKEAINIVGTILPFRVNNYVAENLIDWNNIPLDPIFRLTFMDKGMLKDDQYERMKRILKTNHSTKTDIMETANSIRKELNPHPAGQLTSNVPIKNDEPVPGLQHKYRETALIFPSQGQQCHSYCTFCFRWPQFIGNNSLKFSTDKNKTFLSYLESHPHISDVLITGGDPMIMNAKTLASYIDPLLEPKMEHIRNIRIGSKSLTYWPNRFIDDKDTEEVFKLFRKVREKGKHLAFMAHINHHNEMATDSFLKAVENISKTGAIIRTQSPLIKGINDDSSVWSKMWKQQVNIGMVPYYMFVERNTGPKHFFEVPLYKALKIYQDAIRQVSGLGRTVRGPSMSATPGKVCVEGTITINNEKFFVLNMLQSRNPELVKEPFLAKYDENAKWLDDLTPAFASKFHFD